MHRESRPTSPLSMFIKTVSAMSSALCPVATRSTPSCQAPRSKAYRLTLRTCQRQIFRPVCERRRKMCNLTFVRRRRQFRPLTNCRAACTKALSAAIRTFRNEISPPPNCGPGIPKCPRRLTANRVPTYTCSIKNDYRMTSDRNLLID